MKNEPELITQPTFIMNQGDVFYGGERPIQVTYWRGDDNGPLVGLSQNGNEILISWEYLKPLFKAIEKNKAQAIDIMKI